MVGKDALSAHLFPTIVLIIMSDRALHLLQLLLILN